MSSGSLTLDGITRRYPGAEKPAIDGVSLHVRAGELLALVGASGSGKTTTLRVAAGYEQPDAGEVVLVDRGGTSRTITALPPERRGFGMVFQHYALFPHMTVVENVAFGLEARGVRRRERLERAHQALAAVGLEGKGARAVQALSGGEQQRVALARALVIEPPVLLLDEPLSNLDPQLRQATRDELRTMLRRSGVTALFVTHDQEDAFAVADRVAMLRQGRLLQVGTPEELYHQPVSRYVAEFIGRATLVAAERRGETRAELIIAGARTPATVFLDGHLRGDHSGGWLAVLRPEALEVVPPETPGAWAGEVRTRRFAGGHHEITLRLADDSLLAVSAARCDAREGEQVGVRLRENAPPVPLVRA